MDHDRQSPPSVNLPSRPRRNRASAAIRRLVRETALRPDDFVWPVFVVDGQNRREPIAAMPGVHRLSLDLLVPAAREAWDLGIPAIALFPALPEALKDPRASAARDPDGLVPRSIRALKDALPELCVITDVAMDPYSSDGHDGLWRDGQIVNDESLDILAGMALTQARAGADLVAPSDMMDGRVGYLRRALDAAGYTQTGILAYSAKYCSALYGPFREALDSAPRHGDKKTYQMDPANAREALREVQLDLAEGADIVMVKPALAYLDVIRQVRDLANVPVAAYHVSGEYAMVKAAARQGWLDETAVMHECLTAIKRAGADLIFTYAAVDMAKVLHA